MPFALARVWCGRCSSRSEKRQIHVLWVYHVSGMCWAQEAYHMVQISLVAARVRGGRSAAACSSCHTSVRARGGRFMAALSVGGWQPSSRFGRAAPTQQRRPDAVEALSDLGATWARPAGPGDVWCSQLLEWALLHWVSRGSMPARPACWWAWLLMVRMQSEPLSWKMRCDMDWRGLDMPADLECSWQMCWEGTRMPVLALASTCRRFRSLFVSIRCCQCGRFQQMRQFHWRASFRVCGYQPCPAGSFHCRRCHDTFDRDAVASVGEHPCCRACWGELLSNTPDSD